MASMMEELNPASGLLTTAVEGYFRACSLIDSENHIISRVFADRLTDELSFVASCLVKLTSAKASLSRARNRSRLTPINTLPTEILTRVFELVLSTQDCNGKATSERTNLHGDRILAYPDVLSHVCSRWRQVVTTSPNFWTHIDLIPHHRLSKNLLARAEMSMAQAMQIPLEIHILDTDPSTPTYMDANSDAKLLRFLSAATRIHSLDLTLAASYDLEDFRSKIFEACFTGVDPGTLTQLHISDTWAIETSIDTYLEAVKNPEDSESLLLDFPKQLLEDLWRPITVLQLNGLYPRWTSQAYHGLVELRLLYWPTIPESQLVKILTASPQLRVLHLTIIIEPPSKYQPEPICLPELEVLSLESTDLRECEATLRLLAPGTKPLRLSLELHSACEFPSLLRSEQLGLFSSRSNVAKLHLLQPDASLSLAELRDLFPRLCALALRDCRDSACLSLEANSSENRALNTFPHLDALYMMNGSLDLSHLRCILEKLPVHTITIWKCTISRDGLAVSDEQEIRDHLSEICPAIRLWRSDESPIEDWELYND